MKKYCILIFSILNLGIVASNAQYKDILNFNGTNGNDGFSSLTIFGNELFGMTLRGGAYNKGCVFSIDTGGNMYKDLLDFDGTNGAYPEGTLIISGAIGYGMTAFGGSNNLGCIFSLDTNGSNYKDIFDFKYATGCQPYGSLTISGNKLFGMTYSGGADSSGCIFSINVNGSEYDDIFDFNWHIHEGNSPEGNNLTLSGKILYGMTSFGGAYDSGTIFAIDTDGSMYKELLDFNGSNGRMPYGSLILSNGRLFGTTTDGGAYHYGLIFSIDTDGSGYTTLLNFNGIHAPYGEYPLFSLILSGNTLYGTTFGDNLYLTTYGNIFSIDTNGNEYIDLFDFNANHLFGQFPKGTLTILGNVLFGYADGGTNSDGVIFSFKDNNLGIKELTSPNEAINLFPNPNAGQFTISVNRTELVSTSKTSVEIYNVFGEKIYNETLSKTQDNIINIVGQPSGVYFYRVTKENGEMIGTGKFVIE